jgi:hypothetical protein
MTVNRIKEPEDEPLGRFDVDEQGDFHAEVALVTGQMRGLSLETGAAGPANAEGLLIILFRGCRRRLAAPILDGGQA